MKILVVSDTHGNWLAPLHSVQRVAIDMIIHLGDHIADARELAKIAEVPVIMVPGNCDAGAQEPRQLLESINGHKFYLTHGDIYRVKAGYDHLLRRGVEVGASVILCGHTHIPVVLKSDGVLLINPGTLMAASANKSCAILNLTETRVGAEILYMH